MFNASMLLDRRYEHWLLATMLLLLHAALLADPASPLAASLMTAHLGLFFLWQPLWQRDRHLDRTSLLLVLLFTAGFIGFVNAWLVFAWLIVLVGIVTGRSLYSRRERYAYMLVLAFLMSELLIGLVPLLFDVGSLDPVVARSFSLGLFLPPALLPLLPAPPQSARQTFPIDFFRGIIISLITALLAAGSVLLTYHLDLAYPAALFIALFGVSAFLLFISWLLTPSAAGGLAALWERSVLNIGTPFEAWISRLGALASARTAPATFLTAALEELVATPWLSGAEWQTAEASGHRGERTAHSVCVETPQLTVTLFTEHPIGPALLLHCRLLIETLAHFHAAKLREREQAHQGKLRAIHETGARLTHDIKNLLQSLKLLTDVVRPGGGGEEASIDLLRRQLPHLTQRLQRALDKLQQPDVSATDPAWSLAGWWDQLRARHEGGQVSFVAARDLPAITVPGEALDSIVENLLDNARQKLLTEPGAYCEVTLDAQSCAYVLAVTDTGTAVPGGIASQLLHHVVPSHSGLGIGLYQAARLAERAGLALRLAENRAGCVRFEIVSTNPA